MTGISLKVELTSMRRASAIGKMKWRPSFSRPASDGKTRVCDDNTACKSVALINDEWVATSGKVSHSLDNL